MGYNGYETSPITIDSRSEPWPLDDWSRPLHWPSRRVSDTKFVPCHVSGQRRESALRASPLGIPADPHANDSLGVVPLNERVRNRSRSGPAAGKWRHVPNRCRLFPRCLVPFWRILLPFDTLSLLPRVLERTADATPMRTLHGNRPSTRYSGLVLVHEVFVNCREPAVHGVHG